MPLPPIEPPLLNSSNPWATTADDLQALFDCPYTGAVTTRTSLLHGFDQDEAIHQHTFFNPLDHTTKPISTKDGSVLATYASSLNTYGYSPLPLSTYLAIISKVIADSTLPEPQRSSKPFIISVTGSAVAVKQCYDKIQQAQAAIPNPLCMEINLSCPNIPGKPPPAYSAEEMSEYFRALSATQQDARRVPIGVKTPPYTYHDQFQALIDALSAASTTIDFITATNTLGSSLVLANGDDGTPALGSASGAGIGGMAGAALHPLALGNVRTIRGFLDACEGLRGVDVIGVGGVGDRDGSKRMRAVGAKVVGVGTALGREGVGVFGRILGDGGGGWC